MGSSTILSVLSLLAASVAAGVANAPRASSGCADYHIFLARGNNEPYPGRQCKLVEAVCDGVSSCDYEDLIYSALYTDEYCQTVYDGIVAGFVQLAAYANRCPNSKLILGGYSQGAQIITDFLGGGGGSLFNGCIQPNTPALSRDTAPGSKIVAAIVFGDVRHTAGQPYNYGNGSDINGLFPRDEAKLSALDSYSGVLRDWCSNTDSICAANQTVSYLYSHLGYYDSFASDAGAWVKSVAGIKDDSSFTTAIPTSVSGVVQDYSTIGTETPSGGVVINTSWTLHTAVTAATTTTSAAATTSSGAVSTSSAQASSSTASSVPSTSAASSSASSAILSSSSSAAGNSTIVLMTTSTSAPAGSTIISSGGAVATTAGQGGSSTTSGAASTTTTSSPSAGTKSNAGVFGAMLVSIMSLFLFL